jgi:hypothetical protein
MPSYGFVFGAPVCAIAVPGCLSSFLLYTSRLSREYTCLGVSAFCRCGVDFYGAFKVLGGLGGLGGRLCLCWAVDLFGWCQCSAVGCWVFMHSSAFAVLLPELALRIASGYSN